MTYANEDEEIPARVVEGFLATRLVKWLNRTQCYVDGVQVNPDTVQPVATESRLTLEAGFTGTVTDSAGRKRHYVNGKEVAQSADGNQTGNQTDLSDSDKQALTDSLARDLPEAASNSGTWAKVKDAAITAAAKVYRRMVAMTPAGLAVMDGLGAVLDTPEDMKKFGYNPTLSSGTANTDAAKGADPLATHLGVSTHFAMAVASKVLSGAIVYAKKKLGQGRSESDGISEVAELLAELFASVNDGLGIETPAPDAATIAEAIRGILG